MSNASIVLLCILCFAVGGYVGWDARGWRDGSNTTAGAAAQQAQGAVDAGIEADRKITAGTKETETAVERVRVVTREVQVAAQCPPGAGPVSADMDRQLRELAAARQARAAANAAKVAGSLSR